MRAMSLSGRLILVAVVSVLLIQSANAGLRALREEELFEDDLARDLEGIGRSVATAVEIAWSEGGRDGATRVFDAERVAADRFDLSYIDARDVEPSQLAELEEGRTVTFGIESRQRDEKLVTVLVPVRAVAMRELVGIISVEGKLVDQRAYLNDSLVRTAVASGATALALALALALSITRLVQRPIARLMAATRRIGAGDLTTPVAPEASPDLSELAATLENMRVHLAEARTTIEREARARLEAEVRAEMEHRQREELSSQLRHADRLATLGTLASAVVHELGAPLQVISGRAKMLEGKPGLPPVALEYAGIIREQAERIAALTRNLLDFARRDGDASGSTNVASVVKKALVLLDPVARHAKVEIVVDASIVDAEVAVPEQELWQILTNLASNAIHAMPSGGRLTISAESMAERVAVDVTDTGTGMTEEVRARIFSPFFTTKPPGQGTGLGLTVVDGIVRAHGGDIEVRSVVGAGTTFRLRFARRPINGV